MGGVTTATPPKSATPQLATTDVEWLGVRLHAPADWEIVRHGTAPRKGSLVFADRTRQRLQVTWTACGKRPDVARLLADHCAKQREQDAEVVITTPLLPAGWRGMQRDQAGFSPASGRARRLTRAARFDAKSSRLIEVVLDDEADSELLHDLLAGLVVTGPADTARRFLAFGLDLTIPEGFQLTATRIQPADAALTFSTQRDAKEPDKHPTLTVRRRAMADVWFDGNLRRQLQAHAPRAVMDFTDDDTETFPPHAATSARWNVPGPRYQRLLNLHRVAVACAWLCPEDQAVYDVVAVGPAKLPPTFDGLTLNCGQGSCDH